MKPFAFAVGLLLLAACEPPPQVDPCREGWEKLNAGDLDNAIVAFRKALPLDALHRISIEHGLATAIGGKAASQVTAGNTNAATETLRIAQSISPNVMDLARALLVRKALRGSGDPTKDAVLFQYLLTVAKEEAAPHARAVAARITSAAWQSASENAFEKAAAAFAAAADLLEDNTPEKDDLQCLSLLYKARLLQSKGSLKEARDGIVRTYTRRKNESTSALAHSWVKEALDGLLDEAEKAKDWSNGAALAEEAVKLAPELIGWWYMRELRLLVGESDALFVAGRFEAALAPLQKAGSLPNINASALTGAKIRAVAFRLATAAMREQDWAGAIAHFENAAAVDDQDPLLYEMRVQCYEKVEKWRHAGGDYEMLAKLVPARAAEYAEKAKTTRAKFKASDGDRDHDHK